MKYIKPCDLYDYVGKEVFVQVINYEFGFLYPEYNIIESFDGVILTLKPLDDSETEIWSISFEDGLLNDCYIEIFEV